ncbi:MAG: hypothetical protein IIB83_06575 [Bacteroidetes bacterium]|nr:hypothetical protein [Bacteroidota bacterium]
MKKLLIITLFAIVITVSVAHAGILETVKNIVTDPMRVSIYAGLGIVLAYIFKRIPNNKIQKVVGGIGYGFGVTVTLGLAKWPYTSALWNRTLEPFVIDFIYNVPNWFLKSFIEGMKSDNKPK